MTRAIDSAMRRRLPAVPLLPIPDGRRRGPAMPLPGAVSMVVAPVPVQRLQVEPTLEAGQR